MIAINPSPYLATQVFSGFQRRRRWTSEEEVRIVEETYLPGMSASLVAHRHGIASNQLIAWRRLMTQGALAYIFQHPLAGPLSGESQIFDVGVLAA